MRTQTLAQQRCEVYGLVTHRSHQRGADGRRCAVTVSINDVARVAGVSPSTVSRALRGLQGVSEDVRAQIAAVAAQLGYTASRSASSLASGRTFTIGIIAPYF